MNAVSPRQPVTPHGLLMNGVDNTATFRHFSALSAGAGYDKRLAALVPDRPVPPQFPPAAAVSGPGPNLACLRLESDS